MLGANNIHIRESSDKIGQRQQVKCMLELDAYTYYTHTNIHTIYIETAISKGT